jgi:hypothetical protein
MALYINTSRLCPGPRSLSNPGSFGLRRFSVSTDGRSSHLISNLVSLHSVQPKHASKKALTFASLSLNCATDSGQFLRPIHRLRPRHASCVTTDGSLAAPAAAATYARSSSLFMQPSAHKSHDSAPTTQPLAGAIVVMPKTYVSEDPALKSIPAHPSVTPGSSHDTTSLLTPTFTCIQPHSSPFHKLPPVVFSTPDFAPSISPPSPALPSPVARSRRAVSPSDSPPIHLSSSSSRHTLGVQLPTVIQPDMVTISVKRGDKLEIVADAWHMEANCKLFPRALVGQCAIFIFLDQVALSGRLVSLRTIPICPLFRPGLARMVI